MKCKACNADLTDREAGRKYPGTEEHVDLCTPCKMEIEMYEWEVSLPTDWGDSGILAQEDGRSDEQYWWDFMQMHRENLYATWSDGLGLMDPEKRAFYMGVQAGLRFFKELKRGTARPLAAEIAIKAPWVLDLINER